MLCKDETCFEMDIVRKQLGLQHISIHKLSGLAPLLRQPEWAGLEARESRVQIAQHDEAVMHAGNAIIR